MNINKLNAETMQYLRICIDTELERINKGLEGCQVTLARGRYNSVDGTGRFEIQIKVTQTDEKTGITITAIALQNLKRISRPIQHGIYTVLDYTPRRRKYPWTIYEKGRGRVKCGDGYIKANFPHYSESEINSQLKEFEEGDRSFNFD